MKQQIAAGILAFSMVGGVGAGAVAHQVREDAGDPEAKATASATPTKATKKPTKKPSATAGPGASTGGGGAAQKPSEPAALPVVPVGSLRVVPGAVGPVQVGMSKQAAYGTGYFDADVSVPACNRVDDLVWKEAYRGSVDVKTNDDGSISAIGITQSGPRTRSGLGIGSTYESVKGVIGEQLPVEAGYGQAGLFVAEGNGWIGFLFDTTPEAITDTTPVTFMEVTRGAKPGLVRDGC